MGAVGETLTLMGGQKELTLQPQKGGREVDGERVTTGKRRERRATF